MANPNQGDDDDYFEAARDKKTGAIKQTGLARTAKLSPFGLAFDTARRAGEKTFTFKGKEYTTEMAKPKPKPKAAPAAKPKGETPEEAAKSAEVFKKVAADSRANTDKTRDMVNRMMGSEKFGPMKELDTEPESLSGPFRKGGMVKAKAKGKTKSRGDGCVTKGRTKGRMV